MHRRHPELDSGSTYQSSVITKSSVPSVFSVASENVKKLAKKRRCSALY